MRISDWSSDVCSFDLIGDKGDGDTIGDGVEGPLDVRIAGLIGRHVQTAFHARQVEVPLEPGLDILDGLWVILQLETRHSGRARVVLSARHIAFAGSGIDPQFRSALVYRKSTVLGRGFAVRVVFGGGMILLKNNN